MLTLQNLKDMEPFAQFERGLVNDGPSGINMTNSGRALKWVACRGQIHDWCIYIGPADWSDQMVHDRGDKVMGAHHIKKLIPCDDEAFGMYRY